MPYLSSPVQVKQNLHRLEEVLYDLPPLEGVFLHWHTSGVTSMTPGVISLLSRRRHLLGATTLSAASVQLLAACATDALRRLQWQKKAVSSWENRPLHARVVRHGPLPECSGDPGFASARRAGAEDNVGGPGRYPAALYGPGHADSQALAPPDGCRSPRVVSTERESMPHQCGGLWLGGSVRPAAQHVLSVPASLRPHGT